MTTRGLSVQRRPVEGAVEPVTIEDLKLHLAIDSNDHDDLLNKLLADAREQVELYTGLSLIESNIKARWEELTTCELPYGPVISITSVKDSAEALVTDYSLEGFTGSFVSIKADSSSPVVAEYIAGYENDIPEGLKLAIMKLASDNFSERVGFSITGTNAAQALPNNWKETAKRYTRKSWFL